MTSVALSSTEAASHHRKQWVWHTLLLVTLCSLFSVIFFSVICSDGVSRKIYFTTFSWTSITKVIRELFHNQVGSRAHTNPRSHRPVYAQVAKWLLRHSSSTMGSTLVPQTLQLAIRELLEKEVNWWRHLVAGLDSYKDSNGLGEIWAGKNAWPPLKTRSFLAVNFMDGLYFRWTQQIFHEF